MPLGIDCRYFLSTASNLSSHYLKDVLAKSIRQADSGSDVFEGHTWYKLSLICTLLVPWQAHQDAYKYTCTEKHRGHVVDATKNTTKVGFGLHFEIPEDTMTASDHASYVCLSNVSSSYRHEGTPLALRYRSVCGV